MLCFLVTTALDVTFSTVTWSLTQRANMLLSLFRTFKFGCPVHISASVDRDKGKLVVLGVELHHSHPTSASVVTSYPENRRLDANERSDCARRCHSVLKEASRQLLTVSYMRTVQNVNSRTEVVQINQCRHSPFLYINRTCMELLSVAFSESGLGAGKR